MDTLTIDLLLANACNNPEDAKEYSDFQNTLIDDPTLSAIYPGWRIFTIDLHCFRMEVVARSLGGSKYEIREWELKEN